MLDKDPFSYSILTYLWIVTIASWGGIAGYLHKINMHEIKRFSPLEFIGEVIISSFVGIITFWLCKASGIDELITAASVGLSGHMGSRALFLLENNLRKTVIKTRDK